MVWILKTRFSAMCAWISGKTWRNSSILSMFALPHSALGDKGPPNQTNPSGVGTRHLCIPEQQVSFPCNPEESFQQANHTLRQEPGTTHPLRLPSTVPCSLSPSAVPTWHMVSSLPRLYVWCKLLLRSFLCVEHHVFIHACTLRLPKKCQGQQAALGV